MNKFEQVSSLRPDVNGRGPCAMGPMSGEEGGLGPCTSMGNGRIGSPCEQTDRHTTENIILPQFRVYALTKK